MRARSTWFFASFLVSAGCAGSVGDVGTTPTGSAAPGSGGSGTTMTGGAGNGTTPAGTAGSTGNATGVGGATSATGAAGTTVTLPGSSLQSQPALRLANYEYLNSVHDLLGIQANVPLDPDAPSSGGFRIGGPAGDGTVQAYHSGAITLAAQAVATLGTIEPCFTAASAAGAAAATQTSCASTIATDLATKAYRRPLEATQTTGLMNVYSTIAGKYGFKVGVQSLIEAILQSPYFVYHLELEEQAKGVGKVAVTNYSMASRLSYFLWGSLPDATLLAAAAAGTLTTPPQIAAQATRMVADARTVSGMRNFYEQWLRILDLPLSKAKNLATNIDYAPQYTPAVQTSLRASLDAQIDGALWGAGDSLTALLTGSDVYVDANTAPIFGLTSTSTTLQKMTADPTQRAGIMTHPAIMATFATETSSHPIKRGVFFWDKLLCQPLPNPPPNIPAFEPPIPGQSLRQDFELMTKDVNTCQPCHKRINPLGFLFEHYDSIGHYRTIDDNGQPVNSVATIVGTNDAALDLPTNDAVQFANRLGADSGPVATCLVAQVYRYAQHRGEVGADDTALATLGTAFNTAGHSMKALLPAVTQSESFLYRLNVQ